MAIDDQSEVFLMDKLGQVKALRLFLGIPRDFTELGVHQGEGFLGVNHGDRVIGIQDEVFIEALSFL